jgi:hypothetical protein
LTLIQSSINDVDGISELSKLQNIELWASKSLKDITDTPGINLKDADLVSCNKVNDFSPLGTLKYLEKLQIAETKAIPNVDFIKGNVNLVELSIMESNLLNGNFDICKTYPSLKAVYFDNRRHYLEKETTFNDFLVSKIG